MSRVLPYSWLRSRRHGLPASSSTSRAERSWRAERHRSDGQRARLPPPLELSFDRKQPNDADHEPVPQAGPRILLVFHRLPAILCRPRQVIILIERDVIGTAGRYPLVHPRPYLAG